MGGSGQRDGSKKSGGHTVYRCGKCGQIEHGHGRIIPSCRRCKMKHINRMVRKG